MGAFDESQETIGQTPLHKLLSALDISQLRELLLRLAAQHPHFAAEIVKRAALFVSSSQEGSAADGVKPTQPLSEAELRAVRREVTSTLRSLGHMRPSQAYWHVGSVVDEVRQLLTRAEELVERNDGNNALLILEALTDEYVEGWVNLDDSDGYAGEFFSELGAVWMDAALVANLTAEQRQQWADRLSAWQAEIGDYGIDDVFDGAQTALLHGWDHPPLQGVLKDDEAALGSWEEEPPWYSKELTAARLKALERQERYQEYLNLSRAAGQIEAYVTMLARVGRASEAVELGLRHLVTSDQALTLAKTLFEQGDLNAALQVAEHGLTLDEGTGRLATWLRDLAANAGLDELALRAALIGFRALPSLEAYLRIREMSGDRWPDIRRALLAHLRQERPYGAAPVDVFLHEGLWDDAIRAVDRAGGYSDVERVMDAVLEHRPEWVMQMALKQAERIIEPGQAKYYHHAVNWLERARDAYAMAGRESDWKAYMRDLRDRHGRKYKLMGMIKGL